VKILYSWLLDFMKEKPHIAEVSENLLKLGFQIESMTISGPSFSGVVTGEVLKVEKHPNADRLSVCVVKTGEKKFRVVCGAKNVKEGARVPLARVGATLKGGKLQKVKIRGIESEGMICSAEELGLKGFDNSGILILPKNTPIGVDARTLFGKEDYIFDIEMLANQSYCLSHMTLARELCAFCGYSFKKPEIYEHKEKNENFVEILTEECGRYSAIIVRNVQGIETPAWMKERLRAMDVNPKNNILIDVSNYVMFEMGQPTHCFDLDKLEGGKIKVRKPQKGEELLTLDDDKVELEESAMIIADEKKPVALAGIIGAKESAVTLDTDSILIESAHFNRVSVRKTSQNLSLRTDASYRFERGTDIEMTMNAALRIAHLIKAAHVGAKVDLVCDNYPQKHKPRKVSVDPDRINAILGTNLNEEEIFKAVSAIDSKVNSEKKPWIISPPSYREDIEGVQDVAEEVARFCGYDIIPSITEMPTTKSSLGAEYVLYDYLQRMFASLGFCEAYNYDLISENDIKNTFQDAGDFLEMQNPISSEWRFLRNSLVYGLLKNLKYNLNRQAESVFLFEEGNTYFFSGAKPVEDMRIAGICWGEFSEGTYWKGGSEKADFHLLKGVLNKVFVRFNISFAAGLVFPPFMYKPNSANVLFLGKEVGYVGQVNLNTLTNYLIKEKDVYYFEVSLGKVLSLFPREGVENMKIRFSPVSAMPSVKRDLSIVLKEDIEWEKVKETALRSTLDIHRMEIIDVYKGKNISRGFKSITMRFTFSSLQKTFTDEEVNEKVNDIFSSLSRKLGARLRE